LVYIISVIKINDELCIYDTSVKKEEE